MANNYFQFKRFTIYQDKCAMKVGTDGVLLGSWAKHSNPKRILDAGTGTGLIALMLAQRFPSAIVDAIELDNEAAKQAKENVDKAKQGAKVRVLQGDLLEHSDACLYDLVVSNPPYFESSLLCDTQQRNMARHTAGLNYESLAQKAKELLNEGGVFAVVLPAEKASAFSKYCKSISFYLHNTTWIKTTPTKAPKRALLCFGFQAKTSETESELVVELKRHVYSGEYIELTKDFYLNF